MPQGRDWACNVIRDCPGKRGRFYVLQENDRIVASKEEYDSKQM
jgi:hypothetical protein